MRRWPVFSVLLSGTFLANLDVFIVVVAMPALRRELDASAGQQQLVLAGYQLVYGLGLITGGRLGDRFGTLPVFGVGMGLFTAASAACGLAPSAGALVAARLLQGTGTALLVPQVYAGAQTLFADRARRRAFAAVGAVMGGGAVGGQLLGGWLLSANPLDLGWRSVFLVNVPVGAIALVGLRLLSRSGAVGRERAGREQVGPERGGPERASADRPGPKSGPKSGPKPGPRPGSRPESPLRPRPRPRPVPDLAGTGLAALALGLSTVPLVTAREVQGTVARLAIALCLVAAVPATVAFLRYERSLQERGGEPLLPPELLRLPGFRRGLGLVALANCGLNAFVLLLGLLLQQGLRWSPLATGAGMLPPAVGFVAGSLLAPRLRLRDAGLLRGAAVVAALGYTGCAVSALAHDAEVLLGALAVTGFGMGLFVTPALSATLRTVPEGTTGAASGLVSTVQQLGAALGVCVFGLLFFAVVQARQGFPAAFAVGTAAIAVTTAAGGLLATGLGTSPAPSPAEPTGVGPRAGRPKSTP